MNNLSIYVHIPFCESRCIYCSFTSCLYEKDKAETYFKTLKKEIISKAKLFNNYNVISVYFGGGTPSIVNKEEIADILKILKNYYHISSDVEITIECNPNSINLDKLIFYKSIGINRLSFGVQSLNNKSLKFLGRRHNVHQVVNSLKLAKKTGFENISTDLLIGIPKQNSRRLLNHSKKLIKLEVKHISAYMLSVEDKTILFDKLQQNIIKLPNEDKCVKFYNKLSKFLKRYNMIRYEVSNFAYPGFESIHNKSYWNLTDYIGFGAAAHSFYNRQRINNTNNIENYIKGEINSQIEEETIEKLKEDYIMLSLRTNKGLNLEKYKNLFKEDLLKIKKEEIDFLLKNNFIFIKDNSIIVHNDKFGVLNLIILKLI